MNINTDVDEIDSPMWEILHSPIIISKPEIVYSIKTFNESLKKTFLVEWDNKKKWMGLIQIFKILDSFHFFNILDIYDSNTNVERNIKINNYLSKIGGYNEKNLYIFMKAFDNYLK